MLANRHSTPLELLQHEAVERHGLPTDRTVWEDLAAGLHSRSIAGCRLGLAASIKHALAAQKRPVLRADIRIVPFAAVTLLRNHFRSGRRDMVPGTQGRPVWQDGFDRFNVTDRRAGLPERSPAHGVEGVRQPRSKWALVFAGGRGKGRIVRALRCGERIVIGHPHGAAGNEESAPVRGMARRAAEPGPGRAGAPGRTRTGRPDGPCEGEVVGRV